MATVKSMLEKIKKRDGELNFRSNKTEDYLNQNTILKKKDADELYKKIEELDVSRIKGIHINKIIDIMPITSDELKSLLSGYTLSLSVENLKKIVETVNDYLPGQ